jgi:hypothetical protein
MFISMFYYILMAPTGWILTQLIAFVASRLAAKGVAGNLWDYE